MPKFRAALTIGIVTKPIIIEADSLREAEDRFRSLEGEALMAHADAFRIDITGDILRVPESQPETIEPRPQLPAARKPRK